MFVSYLRQDAPRFARTLELMRRGKTVGVALEVAYAQPVEELWEKWRQHEVASSQEKN
jgi:hypothetical protein